VRAVCCGAETDFSRVRLGMDAGADADVVFDGVDAPTTQTFGLGMFEEPTAESLEEIEGFLAKRGAATMHEVSPMAGAATVDLLCARGYRPIEISSVLYRTVEKPEGGERAGIHVGVVGADEAELWAAVSARGWTLSIPSDGSLWSRWVR
jgi:hypothetical protein